MKYTKYKVGPYNIHIINTDKFKTINVKINFKRELIKEEITYRNFLCELLMQSTKKFPSRRLMEIETSKLYSLTGAGYSTLSGNYAIMNFDFQFLNEKYTEIGMLDKSLDFLMDIIFNPNVTNKQFDQDSFNITKNSIADQINSIPENPERYSTIKLLEIMGEKSKISYNAYGYLDDLDKITPKSIYEYYESVIKSDLIDIFIIGDVNNMSIKKMILSKFKINTLKKPTKSHFIEHNKVRKRMKTVKEAKDNKQSYLIIGSKIQNLNDFERKYVLPVFSYILGGGPDSKLFKKVREENSLCYSISSSSLAVSNLLLIKAGISKSNYNKTIRLIKKEFKNIQKGGLDDTDIEKAKITYISSYKDLMDSPRAIINIYVSQEYLGFDIISDRIREINKVTKEMVINLSKKIYLDTTFLLEGSDNLE